MRIDAAHRMEALCDRRVTLRPVIAALYANANHSMWGRLRNDRALLRRSTIEEDARADRLAGPQSLAEARGLAGLDAAALHAGTAQHLR
jgi:hypothetical protein